MFAFVFLGSLPSLFGYNNGILICPLQLLKVSAEISEYSKNPHHLLLEAIHSTGYSGAYANGLMASEAAVSGLNSSVLEDFVSVSPEHHFCLHYMGSCLCYEALPLIVICF